MCVMATPAVAPACVLWRRPALFSVPIIKSSHYRQTLTRDGHNYILDVMSSHVRFPPSDHGTHFLAEASFERVQTLPILAGRVVYRFVTRPTANSSIPAAVIMQTLCYHPGRIFRRSTAGHDWPSLRALAYAKRCDRAAWNTHFPMRKTRMR